MAYSFDELAERERRRWMKPNANLWARPDADRILRSARRAKPERPVGRAFSGGHPTIEIYIAWRVRTLVKGRRAEG